MGEKREKVEKGELVEKDINYEELFCSSSVARSYFKNSLRSNPFLLLLLPPSLFDSGEIEYSAKKVRERRRKSRGRK
jgi:hypothetical protein